MKVDIRRTRHRNLESQLAREVDGYQQFTCLLERIQSMKRSLSRLQNLFILFPEMKVFDHRWVDLRLSHAFSHPQHSPFHFSEAAVNRRMTGADFTIFTPSGAVRCFAFSEHLAYNLLL